MPRSPVVAGALAPLGLLTFAVGLFAPARAAAVDACDVLTPAEVQQVTGMAAGTPTVMEVWSGAMGCSFATEPFDLRTYVSESSSGAAVDGLGAGEPVQDVGDGARWVWCESCLEADSSSSSNVLVVAQGTTYLQISFEPTTDEAANQAASLQEEQRAWAIDLAGFALARLASPTASAAAVPSGPAPWAGSSRYVGEWTLSRYESDVPIFMPEHEVGDTVDGSITVDCGPEISTCRVDLIRDDETLASEVVRVAISGSLGFEKQGAAGGCPGETDTTTVTVTFDGATATATHDRSHEPRSCEVDGTTVYSIDETWIFSGDLAEFVPAVPAATDDGEGHDQGRGARASAGPSSGAEPAPVLPPADGGGAGADVHPAFAASIATAARVSTDPAVLLQSALLAALLVFLMPFPSQLFNSTLETHKDEVRRWVRLNRIGSAASRIGAFWASWPGVVTFTLLATLLYAFLDPGFGLDVGSLATFLGMLLGIVLVTAAFSIPVVLAHRRYGDRPSVKVVPISLLVGVACVLVSRFSGFQPGYLYGLLIGLAFARELSAAEEGRATAIGAALMLATAVACWIALGVLPAGEPFGLVVVRTALAALMVAGLEGVVFGLLPMRFLPGEPLYAWNRIAWGALLGIGAFAFFHILINPASGYLSDTSRTPLFTMVALLVGFSVASVAFWAWFRFRRQPEAEIEQAG